jgi:hypothetical protein
VDLESPSFSIEQLPTVNKHILMENFNDVVTVPNFTKVRKSREAGAHMWVFSI